MTFLSRDFNMAAPDSVDSKSNTESTVIETENIQDSPVFSDGQLSFLGQDVEEIPAELITEYADRTVRLDLSFNRIKSLSGLEKFSQLRELILDNNELNDDAVFPIMKSLTTLYLNKNRFVELEPLMRQLKDCFPDLRYLSLLGNTACPNQLSSTEKDEEDYQRYRYFVLFHLPQLKFLDSSAVEQAELTEAKRRGQFMHVVRPTERDAEEESGELTPQYTPLPTEPQQYSESKSLGFYGVSKYTYYGHHSEGNRFIRNKDL